MSDRREFLKSVGALSLLPFAEPLSAQTQTEEHPGRSSYETAKASVDAEPGAVVLENREMRLVIGSDGSARSLVHKPTGQECLDTTANVTMFNVTQYRPMENELHLAHPSKITHFPADRVRREGDKLIVDFAFVKYQLTIGLKITDSYIAFRLEDLTYKGYTGARRHYAHPPDETLFLQLPIRQRKNFGDWLNVMWDDDVAVNVLATDKETEIDATPCAGHWLFHAGSVRSIKLKDVGAALIATDTHRLLDRIAQVEQDFHLPKGVQSRRSPDIKHSYFLVGDMTPKDVDRYLKFVKMAGLRQMMLETSCFSKGLGHLPWNAQYPGGMADLQEVMGKIRDAGATPGLHVLHTFISMDDAYVTPKPDPRLSLAESYTLAGDINAIATVIPVEEDPHLCPAGGRAAVLRVGNELIRYESYTQTTPSRFEGCQRGVFGTQAAPHEVGSRVGLLNMCDVNATRVSENTSLQAEIGDRIGAIYKQAGFRFVYFDGSELVPRPYWYNISLAQDIVWDKLEPAPLLAEGSAKTHFSWHMLSRSNAFDQFAPEEMKAKARAYPAAEAPQMAKNFTTLDFGWIGYMAPTEETIGTQPDMLEYVTAVAAAWNCPISFEAGRGHGQQGLLTALEAHPRTPDNMEVTRRWEEVRDRDWLTQQQKTELRNLNQEHTLLVDEDGKFELVPWDQIENVAGAKAPGRAFLFERRGNVWVCYWHTSGEGFLELSLPSSQLKLMRKLGKTLSIPKGSRRTRLPIGELRYLEIRGAGSQEVVTAFQNAKISS